MDEFEIPTDLTSIENTAAVRKDAMKRATALGKINEPTDEQLTELEALADFLDQLDAEDQRRTDEVQARRDRRDAAAKRIAGETDEGDGEGEGEESGEGDGDESGDESGDGEQGDSDDQGEDGEGTEAEPAGQSQAVAAGGGKPKTRRGIAGKIDTSKQKLPRRRTDTSAKMLVAAGVRNHEAGSELADTKALAEAFQTRLGAYPTQPVEGMYLRDQVATIKRGAQAFNGLTLDEFNGDAQALFDAAGDESRLKSAKGEGSLAAAGGWCAPSETLYDLVEMETTDGLLDLPEVNVGRGGIRFTTGPDFADIYAGSGFSQTEAQAIAGATKNCYMVDCPDFEEVRLDAIGNCFKSPILTQSAYPELVRRTLNGIMVAHEHKKSIKMLNGMGALLGTPVTVPNTGSVARSTLTGLELAAEGIRVQKRMAQNATLEVVLPHWARVALRDDLQGRLRMVEPVTDAQLDAHFAARHLSVQFVYGFGDARIVAVPGNGTLLVDFPDTMPAYIYPAGTFVKGTSDVISLDTVYDAADLQVNVYTGAFVEEGILLAKRQTGGGRLTLPVNPTGAVGPATLPNYQVTDA